MSPHLTAMRRGVALGKISALHYEAVHLAGLVQRGVIDHGTVIDALWETADANKLLAIHGPDFIQNVIADAFGASQPFSTRCESAA